VSIDYPSNQLEFEDRFNSESACEDFFFRIRWPDGFACSRCNCKEYWKQSRNRMVCSGCQYQSSLTSGTLFHGTHLSLRIWFQAIWWIVNQKTGVSAAGLQKSLGLGSYRTAWVVLHKIREAMVFHNRSPLQGNIEIDEAWVGGAKKAKRHKKQGHPIVIAAVEVKEAQLGRLRMAHIQAKSTEHVYPFIQANVAQGSHIYTDGNPLYRKLSDNGYSLTQTVAYQLSEDEEILPHIHLVISLLKNWLKGTHQGRISDKHLQAYLDEFVFRFNRRTSHSRGLLFRRVLEGGIQSAATDYPMLIKKADHNI